MRPYAIATLAVVVVCLSAFLPANGQTAPPAAPALVLPPTELPRNNFPRLRRSLDGRDDRYTTDLDSWISHLEELGTQLRELLASEKTEETEDLFAEAMSELALLVRQPEARADGRFAAAYSVIVEGYESFYGESLPEDAFHDEVFAARDELAGLLIDLENPLEADQIEVTQLVATVVPMTVNRTVTSTMEWLQAKPNTLKNWLTRAHTYFPMIEKIFAEEGVPDELKYLAMIESGLRPAVKSRARAVGMWQFMSATGAAYGLKNDRLVDDRMDPEKATRAAARHLLELYEQYGRDWHVALAGYNCSPRCIKRAIASARQAGHENPSYWDMFEYLPRETRGYVPQFIATALMLSNPTAYGLSTDEVAPVYEYEIVPVRGSISLDKVAALAGSERATVDFLNPSLHGGFVPRGRDPYPLRLPVGTSAAFLEALATLPPDALVQPGEYKIRRGDTLGRIATKYGTTVSELKRSNGLRTDRLRVGQVLQVPIADDDAPAVAAVQTKAPAEARPEPVLVRYGTLALRPVAPAGPFVGDAVSSSAVSSGTVSSSTVSSGNASTGIPVILASIRDATTPATSPDASRDESAAASSDPGAGEATVPAVTESAPVVEPPAPKARTVVSYRIRRGDTLTEIARKYGVAVTEVRKWNNLRGSSIRSGATLKLYLGETGAATTPDATTPAARTQDPTNSLSTASVPPTATDDAPEKVTGPAVPVATPARAAESTTYRVKRGDTLFDIARVHSVSIEQLRTWNNLRGSSIRSGQRLTIYSGSTGTQTRTYRVVRGDNLYDIARRHGVTIAQIRVWNGLSSNKIAPGDELRLTK